MEIGKAQIDVMVNVDGWDELKRCVRIATVIERCLALGLVVYMDGEGSVFVYPKPLPDGSIDERFSIGSSNAKDIAEGLSEAFVSATVQNGVEDERPTC